MNWPFLIEAASLIRWISFHLITSILGIGIVRGWVSRRWSIGIFMIMMINLILFNLFLVLGDNIPELMVNIIDILATIVSIAYTVDLIRYAIELERERHNSK